MTEVSGLISMQTMQIAGQLKLTKLLQMKKLQLKLLKQKIAVKAIRTMPKIRQKEIKPGIYLHFKGWRI